MDVDESALTFAESKISYALEYSESLGRLLEQLQNAKKPEDEIRLINMAQTVQREMNTRLSAAVGALKHLKNVH